MFKGVKYRLYIYLALLVVLSGGTVRLAVDGRYIFAAIGILSVVVLISAIIKLYNSNEKKMAFMLDSIDNDDFTISFAESGHDKLFNKSLNRMKELLRRTKKDIAEQERYYELLLKNALAAIGENDGW